jgi:tetratricopeptide (TPR) repeat protein
MSKPKLDERRLDALLQQEKWAQARKLLETARQDEPDSHWILTQLGAVIYEQRRYKQALRFLLASRKIVPDCPLTLWHLASTLDALGKHDEAIRIFTWLLKSKTSPEADPCWESKEWTESLKADCVFRLGVCLRHLHRDAAAEVCFQEYVNLLVSGIEGIYSIEDVKREIDMLRALDGRNGADSKMHKAVDSALRATKGLTSSKRRRGPLELHLAELLP